MPFGDKVVTINGKPVDDIWHWWKSMLDLATKREVKGEANMKMISSHSGVHYYRHLLRPGQDVVIHALE